MLIRTHSHNGTVSEAVYSDCGAYRFRLSRRWDAGGSVVNFIMLNPSRADERQNDPTVERCERRARMLGFGGFCVTNIFAWRETDPLALRRAPQPHGTGTDDILIAAAREAGMVIAAWGVHGQHLGGGPGTERLLRAAGIALHHLGLTKDGHPRHPLYLPYSARPVPWVTPARVNPTVTKTA